MEDEGHCLAPAKGRARQVLQDRPRFPGDLAGAFQWALDGFGASQRSRRVFVQTRDGPELREQALEVPLRPLRLLLSTLHGEESHPLNLHEALEISDELPLPKPLFPAKENQPPGARALRRDRSTVKLASRERGKSKIFLGVNGLHPTS